MRRPDQEHLRIVPATLKQANALVRRWHRHHGPVVGHKFSLAVVDEAGRVRGAAIVGRPVARSLDDGWTAEVARVVTDPEPCPNAIASCSRTSSAEGCAITGSFSNRVGRDDSAAGAPVGPGPVSPACE